MAFWLWFPYMTRYLLDKPRLISHKKCFLKCCLIIFFFSIQKMNIYYGKEKSSFQYGVITWSYGFSMFLPCFQYHVRKSTKIVETRLRDRPQLLLSGCTIETEESCLAEACGKSWLFFSFLFSQHKLTFFSPYSFISCCCLQVPSAVRACESATSLHEAEQ